MDFSWSPKQKELYDRVFAQAAARLTPLANGAGEHGERSREGAQWSREEWKTCGELGLLGLSAPTEFGGQGFDAMTTALALEAFGRASEELSLPFSVAAHLLACAMPIVQHGSPETKHRFLPGMCRGELVGGNGMTEADAGSDTAAIRTRAIRDGDGYRLTGDKTYVGNGPAAGLYVVYATTDPQFGWMGLTAFVVERESPGVAPGAAFKKMGLSRCPTGEVSFRDCWVPVANRLGEEGQGAAIFQDSMLWERACLFAIYIGMLDRQLERCLHRAETRRQFGAALGQFQAISHRLVDMKLRVESARLMLYRACWAVDCEENPHLQVALSKLAISEVAIRSSLDCLQIFGGSGYKCDTGVEAAVRDSVPATLFSGTSEIIRNLAARELGL